MDTSFLPQPNERQLAVLRDLSSQMKTREGDAYRDVNAYVSTSDYKDMHYAVKQHVLPFARNFDRLSETYLSAAPFNARLDRLPSHLGSVQNINRIINSVRLPFPARRKNGATLHASRKRMGHAYHPSHKANRGSTQSCDFLTHGPWHA